MNLLTIQECALHFWAEFIQDSKQEYLTKRNIHNYVIDPAREHNILSFGH